MNKVFQSIDSLVNRIAKNYTLWIVGGVVVVVLIGLKAYSLVFPTLPQSPVYANYQVLQPEWSNDRREKFYQTSQGSLVMPYAWYHALESRTGREMFASPEVQVRYGLLPDNDPEHNPDQLPVGIVKDVVRDEYVPTLGQGHKVWASISCAACHTGQILYKGTAMRIDGGQAFWGFEQWSGDLVDSLLLTSATPSKFERFCGRVYGHGADGRCSKSEKETLAAELKRYFNSDLILGGINENINHTYLSKEGFGRTAALGRGVNGEFAPLDYKNVNRNSGPVSFPPLWYTHDFDWVQSPAAIRQPLGRNVTEAWGVSVHVELNDPATRFASTARIDNMFWVETLLSTLRAPKWPEAILGPIDRQRAERGRRLFEEAVWDKARPASEAEIAPDPEGLIGGPNPARPTTGYCARCHAPALETQPNRYGRRFLQLPLFRQDVMGTDQFDAMQFRSREVYTGILSPLFGNKEKVGIGVALTVTISAILNKWFNESNVVEPCRTIMEGYRENTFRAPPGYPARPLDGYWATGPFLHNGSVPTLYQLLSPAAERPKTFLMGTREFDPVNVGFEDLPVEGAFVFDTSNPGNSNAGHEFRDAPPNTPGVIGPLLTRDQRLDIIEYMKVLDNVKLTPQQLAERGALLDAMAPYYENYSGQVPFGTPEKEGGPKKADFCTAVVQAASAGTRD
jgi:RoxA-like, cytochrome c-like